MKPNRETAAGKVQAEQVPPTGVEPEPVHDLAALQEPVSQAHHVQNLQRPRMDRQRPGLQCHTVALVDDAGRNAARQQFRGQPRRGLLQRLDVTGTRGVVGQ
jgi:hypothetical protein